MPELASRLGMLPVAAEGDRVTVVDRSTEISELLATLYKVVDRLELLFPGRKFTPDGHLVGSIGEVLAARLFGLELLPASAPDHDATAEDGRMVQIKFTQGNSRVALRAEPEHLLVLRLCRHHRSVEIVYNGNGSGPWSKAGKMQKNGQRPISLKCLRDIDESVPQRDRLNLRVNGDPSRPIRL